jgi:hypothetical protein
VQHAVTFSAETEVATGADLPQLVKDEFDAFHECVRRCKRPDAARRAQDPRRVAARAGDAAVSHAAARLMRLALFGATELRRAPHFEGVVPVVQGE